MTATVVDLKCPACGHLVGNEEYERVVANFDRFVEEKMNGQIEQLRYERDMKDELLQQMKKKFQDREEQYERNTEKKANEMATSKIREMDIRHRDELSEKDRQSRINQQDEIERVVSGKDRQFNLERAGYHTQIQRYQTQVEEQKRTIDNIPSELRGTRGEIALLDDLHNAFPDDELVPKIVGVEMADIIQTVVENREKIAPPIVWDRKTSDKVTPSDICKAKQYKTTHNTDYSIIVTQDITMKDSNNRMFGERDGIKLVHPTAVVDMARIFRSVIIDKAKQTSSNKDRTSKEAKLYEYLKSSEYARAVEWERKATMSLDDLQRKEVDYHETTWKNRKKLVDELRKIGEQKQQKINDIMRSETGEDSKDDSNKKEEE